MKKLAQTMFAALPILFVLPGDLSAQAKKPQPTKWDAPARASRKKNPIAANAKSIAAGKATFQQLCAVCHGPEGKGNGPAAPGLTPKPHDLTAASVAAQTDGALYWKIRNGRSPMPTFGPVLKKEQVWKVIRYVRTLAPKTTATRSKSKVLDRAEEKVSRSEVSKRKPPISEVRTRTGKPSTNGTRKPDPSNN